MKLKFSKLAALILVPMLSMVGCQEKEMVTAVKGEEKQVIVVGTSGKYEPYSLYKDGKVEGFEADVWEEIGKRANLEVKWEIAGFNGLFGMLDSGKIDTLAQQVSISKEREEKYNFSEVYAYNPLGIIVHEDINDIKSLDDLQGKKAGFSTTAIGKSIVDEYNKTAKTPIEPIVYGDGGSILKDVELGRINATFLAEASINLAIQKSGYKLKYVKADVYDEINAYPFRKDEKGDMLREIVDAAIKSMHEDGTLSEISMKWCGVDVTKNNEGSEK